MTRSVASYCWAVIVLLWAAVGTGGSRVPAKQVANLTKSFGNNRHERYRKDK